jgi:pyocin large subunit-like protein
MRKIAFRILFFVLISFSVPLCCQPDLAALELTAVRAGDFAPGQLEAHYLKHGFQFGQITQDQYLQAAKALLDAAPGEDVLEKVRPNGDVEHYRVSTDEFVVMTKRGRIRTYLKTSYWYWMRH